MADSKIEPCTVFKFQIWYVQDSKFWESCTELNIILSSLAAEEFLVVVSPDTDCCSLEELINSKHFEAINFHVTYVSRGASCELYFSYGEIGLATSHRRWEDRPRHVLLQRVPGQENATRTHLVQTSAYAQNFNIVQYLLPILHPSSFHQHWWRSVWKKPTS